MSQGRRRPRIQSRLASELPGLVTDALRLKIALKNVIGNAVKYGRADVQVNVRPTEGGLEFAISDRGPGIPLAEQRQVFEAFRRGTSVPKASDGVGLGLYVSRRLVESLGGSIDLDSGPGSGSTFRLWVPNRMDAPCTLEPSGGGA